MECWVIVNLDMLKITQQHSHSGQKMRINAPKAKMRFRSKFKKKIDKRKKDLPNESKGLNR